MDDSPEKKFKVVVMMILFVILGGTLGYMLITGQGILDSLYMVVISITTVGYREIFEPTATLKIFNMVLILSGVAAIFYGLMIVMQMVVEGHVLKMLGRKKMEKELKRLKNHYIVAGYGRVGQIVCEEIIASKKPLVVLENKPEMIDLLVKRGIPYVEGNSTEDEFLIQAGIETAAGIVSAIPSEADNVYLALSARQLNPKLKIIARSDSGETDRKLYLAGADRVICPHRIGGTRMALSLLRPNVMDFMELESAGEELGIAIEEIIVPEGSSLDGIALRDSDLKKTLDLMVVAIKKPDKTIHFNPSENTKIETGNILVLIGHKKNLSQLDLMTKSK